MAFALRKSLGIPYAEPVEASNTLAFALRKSIGIPYAEPVEASNTLAFALRKSLGIPYAEPRTERSRLLSKHLIPWLLPFAKSKNLLKIKDSRSFGSLFLYVFFLHLPLFLKSVAPRFSLILLSFLVFFLSCKNKKTELNPHFSYHSLGYYYQLLAFEEDHSNIHPKQIAWLSATFKTQSDSIFWDSFNNMNDKFYVRTDTSAISNLITHYVSHLAPLDSVCMLIKPKDFFTQQFRSDTIPFFSKADSCVKIFLKVKQLYSEDEFLKVQQDLELNEMRQIYKFYTTEAEAGAAMDPMGFYWVEKGGPETGPAIKTGNTVSIAYEGYFLNGRFLERSESDFELKYGTPDQLLKGLNYVISQLKLGQNAKIILPSRLAFGENGSSNGIVPPYTPLLYKIKLTDIKE